jgi:hypothetical protein
MTECRCSIVSPKGDKTIMRNSEMMSAEEIVKPEESAADNHTRPPVVGQSA